MKRSLTEQREAARMVEDSSGDPWHALWRCLESLQEGARRLRHLSQAEPLLGARPDYPRARIGRSRANELRETLDGIIRNLAEVRRLLPVALPGGTRPLRPPGAAPEEAPEAIHGRLDALARIVASLHEEAFQPSPPLPAHAPPYLAAAPSRALPGSKAVQLSHAIDEGIVALRNMLLGILNTEARPG